MMITPNNCVELLVQELQVRQDLNKPILGSYVLTPNVDSLYINAIGKAGLNKIMYPAKPSTVLSDKTFYDVLQSNLPDAFIVWSTPVAG